MGVETFWFFSTRFFSDHSGFRVQLGLLDWGVGSKLGRNDRFSRKTSTITVKSRAMEYDKSFLGEQQSQNCSARKCRALQVFRARARLGKPYNGKPESSDPEIQKSRNRNPVTEVEPMNRHWASDRLNSRCKTSEVKKKYFSERRRKVVSNYRVCFYEISEKKREKISECLIKSSRLFGYEVTELKFKKKSVFQKSVRFFIQKG